MAREDHDPVLSTTRRKNLLVPIDKATRLRIRRRGLDARYIECLTAPPMLSERVAGPDKASESDRPPRIEAP